jgi:hypothetical protein
VLDRSRFFDTGKRFGAFTVGAVLKIRQRRQFL